MFFDRIYALCYSWFMNFFCLYFNIVYLRLNYKYVTY